MVPNRRAAGSRAPRARRDDGAAAVEFALLLPVLLLVLFGIIDFGRAFNMQIALTQASREGVRGLALGTVANPTSKTQSAAYPVTGVTVAYTACPASPLPTSVATVTASKTFTYVTPISPILNLLGFSSLAAPTIQGKAEMRCGG
jgi:Flp pilus assembly protein TadG